MSLSLFFQKTKKPRQKKNSFIPPTLEKCAQLQLNIKCILLRMFLMHEIKNQQ